MRAPLVNSVPSCPGDGDSNDQSPETANELNANPIAAGWLQGLVAAPPDQRQQMVQQVQAIPALQPYLPVIFQVANSCNNY
jgi:hemophore-related protein